MCLTQDNVKCLFDTAECSTKECDEYDTRRLELLVIVLFLLITIFNQALTIDLCCGDT